MCTQANVSCVHMLRATTDFACTCCLEHVHMLRATTQVTCAFCLEQNSNPILLGGPPPPPSSSSSPPPCCRTTEHVYPFSGLHPDFALPVSCGKLQVINVRPQPQSTCSPQAPKNCVGSSARSASGWTGKSASKPGLNMQGALCVGDGGIMDRQD
jgi:hypothetical protein